MPRRSQASLSVLRPRVDGRATRLSPPPDLDEPERLRFLEVVRACAPDHFRQSDTPLLVEYVRTAILCERAAAAMRADGGPVMNGGKVSPWFGVSQRAARTLMVLSARLRLNPQSRSHPRSIARQQYRAPSAYDEEIDDA